MEDFTRKVSGQDQTYVIRHGLGARGIDFIETDAYNASPSGAYPLYDGHGNMIATLTKSGGTFQVSARRYTDPWGVTRVGASTCKPDQRYCANLGHRQDDESGLTYMRARYYEPTTGRFVGEDPAMDGGNWFVYSSNAPTCRVHPSGKSDWYVHIGRFLGFSTPVALMILGAALDPAARAKAIADIGFLLAWFSLDLRSLASEDGDTRVIGGVLFNGMVDLIVVCSAWNSVQGTILSSSSPALKAFALAAENAGFLALFMSLEEFASGG